VTVEDVALLTVCKVFAKAGAVLSKRRAERYWSLSMSHEQAVLFSGAPEDPENSYFREDSNMSIGKLGNAVSGVVYIGPAPALVTLMAVL
jgi:hypothetical protein